MLTKRIFTAFLLVFLTGLTRSLWGSGAGSSVGLTLIEVPSARLAAMGEGSSALWNDVSVMAYNPAALSSLEDGQISLLYHKGQADDAYGCLVWGQSTPNKGFGLSVGMYDGGDVTLFNGTTEKTVNAQKDLVASLGFSQDLGNLSLGLSGKLFSSELAEREKAKAFLGDLGIQFPLSRTVRLAAAYQNFGGKVSYLSENYSLPQTVRIGAALQIFRKNPSYMVVDVPYFLNGKEIHSSIGLEVNFHPVLARVGYKTGSDLEGFTAGAGINLGKLQLDYSFGLVDGLDNRHRLSLVLHYGGAK